MLETDKKQIGVVNVDLVTTETIGGKVSAKKSMSASSAAAEVFGKTTAMDGSVSDFAARQATLNVSEPAIKNNSVLGPYHLNDEEGLQHGTYLEATNRESHKKSRSQASQYKMKEIASLVNYKAASDLTGYGHVKNTTDVAKSIEVVYTMPSFESVTDSDVQLVIDGDRVNEFDGLQYKDEKGNVIPGFDITYSYQGHDGEYSTIDTLKQRDDFSWDKVTAVMVFGSLLPNSSYRINFPLKVVKNGTITAADQIDYSLNEYAFYDLTANKHVNSRLNFRLSTPVFSLKDYGNTQFAGLMADDDQWKKLPEELQKLMPTLAEIPSVISNFTTSASLPSEVTDQGEKVLWQGGYYFFTLAPIQNIVQEHGFSVSVNETGHKLMNAYAYAANSEHAVENNAEFIPYLVLHQLLQTQEFVLKTEKKESWSHDDGIVKVCGLTTENEEIEVDPEQTFIVDDSEIDENKAGEYQVMIGYYLNGSEDADMLITCPTKVRLVENKQTINIYYVDIVSAKGKDKDRLQPADGALLKEHTQSLTGKGDTVYHNQLFGTASGYEIFKADPAAEEGTYVGGQPAQDYYVYLTHKVESINEQHKITRKITFNMPAGAKQLVKQAGSIQRFGLVDRVTGEKKWGAWTKATLLAVNAPVVAGYTSDSVEAEPVTLTSKSSNVTIDYQPATVSAKVEFVDEEGKLIASQTLQGLAGELIDFTDLDKAVKLADEGYTVIKNSLITGARFSADGDKKYEIVLSNKNAETQPVYVYYIDVPFEQLPLVKPTSGKVIETQTQKLQVTEGNDYSNKLWDFDRAGYELFQADEGATAGKYVAGSQAQRYYVYLTHKVIPLEDHHTVKRTINIKMPDNTEQAVLQTATATRTGYHDEVTNKDVWQDWQDATLPEYQPAKLAGYKAETVVSEVVTAESADSKASITYVALPAQMTINFIDQLGETLASKVVLKGVTGEKYNYDSHEEIEHLTSEGYHLVTNDIPADDHFAAGARTYTVKFNKLAAVQPQSETEIKQVNTKEKPVENTKPASAADSKKGIFSTLKGFF